MMTWDDELIAAYVDGELHNLIDLWLEVAMAADPVLAQRVDTQRRLAERLRAHYEPVAAEPVPHALMEMLRSEPAQPDNVVRIGAARSRTVARRVWVPAALAASLAAGLFGGTFLAGGSGTDPLAARGELAQALDTRLAADQPAGSVRIGVTFRNQGGAVCRTFDGVQAGFACRDNGTWRIQMLAPGSGTGDGGYRQTGSSAAAVMQIAQDTMAGDPADGAEERRLRETGWH